MLPFLLWYVIVLLVGLAAFPLTYRLLKALPDRGYAFARIFGLLVWGYGYWLLGSLGVLQNDIGALLLTLGLLLALGLWALQKSSIAALRELIRRQRRHVITAEIVFLLAFGGWVLVRAANPEIFGTEKPMELAFINAILKSPAFPPNDPWLSGYAISYYYFGYVLAAMLAQFSGLTASVAFNMALALVFGLSALGAYGLVYNLLEVRKPTAVEPVDEKPSGSWALALLGPIFVLLISNLEGILEVLHARGIFWQKDVSGTWTSRFWTWLDIPQLLKTPTEPLTWLPDKYGTGSWWWWQASRVVQDYDLLGNWREVIDEFPFFSFLLADLHPHVLAIPFAFLSIALALNLYLGGAEGETRVGSFMLRLSPSGFISAGLVLGGLAFLNTWDFPMYVALFAGAYALVQIREFGWEWARLWEFLRLGIVLGAAGVLLYLPFYIGFASQAGGILPNLIYPTRGAHLWVMFGLFFLPLFSYLIYMWKKVGARGQLVFGLMVTGGLTLLLFLFTILLGGLLISLPLLENLGLSSLGGFGLSALRDMYLGSLGAGGAQGDLIQEAVLRRLVSPGTWLTLFVLLALTIGLLLPVRRATNGEKDGGETTPNNQPFLLPFFLLIVLLGALLVYGPEFFYLRDQFGWRINTIFKFYYQAWLIWGIAVAFGLADMLRRTSRSTRIVLEIGLVVLVAVGLVYPVLSLWDRTNGFNPPLGYSLDGTQQGYYLSGDDAAAADWLQAAPIGVVAEAIGGSYSQFARVSANSGNPTVLGWPGHESQWRGGATEMGTRERDIEHLYSTRDWREAERILKMYDIRYVYIGPLERSTYPVNDRKFQQHLSPIYSQGAVTIYEVP